MLRYSVFLPTYAPRQQERNDVLGYLYNNGGLNNQKMALSGLLLAGAAGSLPVNLPYIHIKDQRIENELLVNYEDVFDIGPVLSFAGQYDIPEVGRIPSGERGGWPFFFAFGENLNCVAQPEVVRRLLTALLSIRPKIVADPMFIALKDFVFATLGIHTTLQLRIERDWRDHAQRLPSDVKSADDIAIGFDEILRRTANTFPDLRLAYVTADELSMPVPKEDIRSYALGKFGIRLIWKSDLVNLAEFTPLDLSLIDFEIARYSSCFIGLSFSTFSNLLCLEKFARSRRSVTGHFVYNHPGDVLRERRDNGFAISSGAVVNQNWSDGLWAESNLAKP
jgi:hypothetical protein